MYLLLIIFADQVKGTGRLSSKALKRCLGSNFSRDQLEKAAPDLENLRLVKLDFSSIKFVDSSGADEVLVRVLAR